jgi:hypothetical protein
MNENDPSAAVLAVLSNVVTENGYGISYSSTMLPATAAVSWPDKVTGCPLSAGLGGAQ